MFDLGLPPFAMLLYISYIKEKPKRNDHQERKTKKSNTNNTNYKRDRKTIRRRIQFINAFD